MNLVVAPLCRPEIQGRRRNFIHDRNGQSIDSHVNGFEIVLANFTGLDSHSRNAFRRVSRELLMMLFSTGGAKDPAKFPLGLAKRAQKQPLATIAFGPDYGELRVRLTVGALVPCNLFMCETACSSKLLRLGL